MQITEDLIELVGIILNDYLMMSRLNLASKLYLEWTIRIILSSQKI